MWRICIFFLLLAGRLCSPFCANRAPFKKLRPLLSINVGRRFAAKSFVSYSSLTTGSGSNSESLSSSQLINEAYDFLDEKKVDEAFQKLSEVYALDPNCSGLERAFEACLRLRIELSTASYNENLNSLPAEMELSQDKMGLASLLIDQERYEEAGIQLRDIVSALSTNSKETANTNDARRVVLSKASSMLFRTQASACQWDNAASDGVALRASIRQQDDQGNVLLPPVHPFEALKWPCVSLEDATYIARQYSLRTERGNEQLSKHGSTTELFTKQSNHSTQPSKASLSAYSQQGKETKVLKIGYISPDFTGKHPLAFLMQNVFALHDKSRFRVYLYSLSKFDGSEEVQSIKNSADEWRVLLSPQGTALSVDQVSDMIVSDDLDIMVDLCGHAGTHTVSEIMSRHVAPLQVSYMGFPGSSGADYIDFLVCDATVVPPSVPHIRRYYSERLMIMPHCYFVNSHSTAGKVSLLNKEEKQQYRQKYGLPTDAFVFCCHSRPDKIDPVTFRAWLRALSSVQKQHQGDNHCAVLSLLRSGQEMEHNLRKIAQQEYGLEESSLIFVDVAPREEHLARLAVADLFLDTPAYNAHTVGCDALYAGVPMVSLLRPDFCVDMDGAVHGSSGIDDRVATDKMASRVGASLLKASGMEDLVVSNMLEYEETMVRCALDKDWFDSLRKRLTAMRATCPLFDTELWVRCFEAGLAKAVYSQCSADYNDIVILCDEDGTVDRSILYSQASK